MAFRAIVRGLTRLPLRFDGTGTSNGDVALSGMAGAAIQVCPDFFGVPTECPAADAGSATFSVALADIPFNTAADLFAVRVGIDGPSLGGASCHIPVAPTDSPCVPGGPAYYDGTLDGGDYVRVDNTPDGYLAVVPEFHADNTVAPTGVNAHTFWPDDEVNVQTAIGDTGSAYLVNPAPTWPTPDAFGNEFGMVLFTLAQLPGAVSTMIDYFSEDSFTDGEMVVAVFAYVINDVPPDEEGIPYGDVAGYV